MTHVLRTKFVLSSLGLLTLLMVGGTTFAAAHTNASHALTCQHSCRTVSDCNRPVCGPVSCTRGWCTPL
jgi:hypothetical protein